MAAGSGARGFVGACGSAARRAYGEGSSSESTNQGVGDGAEDVLGDGEVDAFAAVVERTRRVTFECKRERQRSAHVPNVCVSLARREESMAQQEPRTGGGGGSEGERVSVDACKARERALSTRRRQQNGGGGRRPAAPQKGIERP